MYQQIFITYVFCLGLKGEQGVAGQNGAKGDTGPIGPEGKPGLPGSFSFTFFKRLWL